MFTQKKILTKYNYNNREWDLVKTNDQSIPTFSNCKAKVIDDQLFVFYGYAALLGSVHQKRRYFV